MYEDLLPLARTAITSHLNGDALDAAQANYPPSGCFVSLKSAGRLRGCIGTVLPVRERLDWEVQSNAVAAATRDPRFDPVAKAELARIVISLDVLSPPESVQNLDLLDSEEYGLIVRHGNRCGVLLPAIAGIESPQRQLEVCLEKGGIGAQDNYTLERFTVHRVDESGIENSMTSSR